MRHLVSHGRRVAGFGERRQRMVRAALVGLIGVPTFGAVVLLMPAAVRAAPSNWSVIPSPNPSSGAVLQGVSCRSATFCMGVGISGNDTLIESWNGTAWTVVPSPSPGAYGNDLYGVSCPATNFCVAVGNDGEGATLIESWDGTAWSVVPSPSPSSANILEGVACVSAVACTAVGESRYDALIESWNGSSWVVVPSPNPGSTSDLLDGVSCTSPTQCVAVGTDYSGYNGQALAETWNGTSWTAATVPIPGNGEARLEGVSCATPTDCVAVGAYIGADDYQTLVESWNGSTWNPVSSPTPTNSTDSALEGVSCTGSNDCVAAGVYQNPESASTTTSPTTIETSVQETLIETWDGTAWTVTQSPSPSQTNNQVNGVTCPTSDDCTAVGSYSTGTANQTLVENGISSDPTATINSPDNGQTYPVGQIVPTNFSCSEGTDGSAITTCVDSNSSTSPGQLDMSNPGTFTYTVTATDADNNTGTATITYTVADPPSTSITSPANNQTYAVGQVVPSNFTCSEGADGPGLSTCTDSNGSTSPGRLVTATPGTFTYTVTATSFDGQTTTASIGYTVAEPAIAIAPTKGLPDASVIVSGGHFWPNETVKVSYQTGLAAPHPISILICSGTAASDGSFTCNGTIPSAASAGALGTHNILAKGKTSLLQATTTFKLK